MPIPERDGSYRGEWTTLITKIHALLPSSRSLHLAENELKTLLKSRDEEVKKWTGEALGEWEQLMGSLKEGYGKCREEERYDGEGMIAAEDGFISHIQFVFDPAFVSKPSMYADGLVFQLEVEVGNFSKSWNEFPTLN